MNKQDTKYVFALMVFAVISQELIRFVWPGFIDSLHFYERLILWVVMGLVTYFIARLITFVN